MLDLVSETEPQVERLGVEDLPPSTARKPRRPSASSSPLPSDPDPYAHGPAELPSTGAAWAPGPVVQIAPPAPPTQTLATGEILRVAAMVLSARALVLVFGLCGFAIALIAAIHESREVLWVFVAWNVLTVIPAIALEMRRREE